MQVNVLALEGVFDTGLSIVLDALTTANELLEMQRSTVPRWNVSVVGVRRRVATGWCFKKYAGIKRIHY
jgi:hypothetical protein